VVGGRKPADLAIGFNHKFGVCHQQQHRLIRRKRRPVTAWPRRRVAIAARHLSGMPDINEGKAWTQTDDEDPELEVSTAGRQITRLRFSAGRLMK
jgi:hypothetical protein